VQQIKLAARQLMGAMRALRRAVKIEIVKGNVVFW